MSAPNTKDLAKQIRLSVIQMVNSGGSSHIGSILSVTDIIAVLYGSIMKYDQQNPDMEDRDRLILSKGHAGAVVYAALARCGYFSTLRLSKHCKDGSFFGGHVSHKGIPGVEVSTGSLGHGLPIAVGMAYYAKISQKNHRVFCVLGDGEMNEGSNWEAIMFASHHNLSNLNFIIDKNNLQGCGSTEDILSLEPLDEKLKAFGCKVEVIDGHCHKALNSVLGSGEVNNKPNAIVANTVKGKGVSFMEDHVAWHYKTPIDAEYDRAVQEIKEM